MSSSSRRPTSEPTLDFGTVVNLSTISRGARRLVVDLLVAVGARREAAEADAEGMEHHVSKITLKAFARFLAERARMEA